MRSTIKAHAKLRAPRDYNSYRELVLEIYQEMIDTGKYVYNALINDRPMKLEPQTLLPQWSVKDMRELSSVREIEEIPVEILVD